MARIIQADDAGIRAAAAALRNGDIIGLPTETVYGLAADATNDDAVRKVFAVKGRPTAHPLIVHIAKPADLALVAADVPTTARRLVEKSWPGPLTVIVRANDSVSRVVTGGRDTVAVRCPAHPVARRVIEALGRPVAAPSANRFGRVSPTTAAHVVDDLGDDIDLVLDGGTCEVGLESTIVDCTTEEIQVLRPGAVTIEHIRGTSSDDPATLLAVTDGTAGESRAPGMLDSHYAPRARLVLHEMGESFEAGAAPILDFSRDVMRAARDLYAALRALDDEHVPVAHVILPPADGLGVALRDRLTKAAAGR